MPAKVDVVPLAAEPPAGVAPTGEAELRARLGLGERAVVLSPGAKRPHKNLVPCCVPSRGWRSRTAR